MGAPPACDIPAWMVRALAGEGVIEVRQPRFTLAAAVAVLAGGTYGTRQGLHRLSAHGGRAGVVAWMVLAALLVGAGLRLLASVLLREATWAIGPDGVSTPGWRPGRRWQVGPPSDPSWRWDERAWRLRPVRHAPELRVRERQLRFVPANRPAHAS